MRCCLCCPWCCRELLDQRHRFAVMSVGSKLLVLLPTHVGTLVGIRTRTKALCEELTDEVVKTILAVSTAAAVTRV